LLDFFELVDLEPADDFPLFWVPFFSVVRPPDCFGLLLPPLSLFDV